MQQLRYSNFYIWEILSFKSSTIEEFLEKGVLKLFSKFTGKHSWVFFCEFAAYFQNTFFIITPLGDCFWSFDMSRYSPVNQENRETFYLKFWLGFTAQKWSFPKGIPLLNLNESAENWNKSLTESFIFCTVIINVCNLSIKDKKDRYPIQKRFFWSFRFGNEFCKNSFCRYFFT